MTPGVCTSWYRAPELFTAQQLDTSTGETSIVATKYTRAVDVWGVGCVAGEMMTCLELFAESTDAGVARLIRARLGDKTVKYVKPICTLADLRFPRSHQELEPHGKDFIMQTLQLDASARPAAAALCVHPLVADHGSVRRAVAGGVSPGKPAAGDARSPGVAGAGCCPQVPAPAGNGEPSAQGSGGDPADAKCDCSGFCISGKNNHADGCQQLASPGSSVCLGCRCKAVRKVANSVPVNLEFSSGSEADLPSNQELRPSRTPKKGCVGDSRSRSRVAPGERCTRQRARGETCRWHPYSRFSLVLKACRRFGRLGLLENLIPCDIEAFLAAGCIHEDLVLQLIGAWLKHPVAIMALNTHCPRGKSYSPWDLMRCLHHVSGT